MSIRKGIECQLNVKPVFVDFTHEYVYEGPCRFGQGDSLTPEFDKFLNNEVYKAFLAQVREHVPAGVNLMEPVRVCNYTDAFCVNEEDMRALTVADDTDVYLFTAGGRSCQELLEFARRCKKPIVYFNDVLFAVNTDVTSLRARGLEVYPLYDWEDAPQIFGALRARKALQNTRALILTRFSTDYSPVSAQDGFLSLDHVCDKLGVKFAAMNIHEYLDQLTVRPADENPTLPGRVCSNITPEDMKEIERLTDELMAGAVECEMTRENLIPSVRAYYLTKKLLAERDCNAFSAPCPDMCSTRRLNQEKCTLCLTHSLLEEQGIPSACEIDLNILLCKVILENLTYQATYMGNTCWLRRVNGKMTAPDFSSVTEEEYAQLDDNPNLMVTLHSVANRKLKGYDQPEESYALRSFAYSGWGATMRYDFAKDKGHPVTVIRLNPTCDKMLIIRGKIQAQLGYRRQNCSTACIYEVENARHAYEQTFSFGSHMALAYGDHTEALVRLCGMLGLEPVVV